MDAIFLAHQHVKALHCVVGKKKHVDHVSCSVQCFWLSTLVECFSLLTQKLPQHMVKNAPNYHNYA